MFPEGGQTRKHCFLAMLPNGRQTRIYYFPAPEVNNVMMSSPTCVQGDVNQVGTQSMLHSLRTVGLSSNEHSASNVSW